MGYSVRIRDGRREDRDGERDLDLWQDAPCVGGGHDAVVVSGSSWYWALWRWRWCSSLCWGGGVSPLVVWVGVVAACCWWRWGLALRVGGWAGEETFVVVTFL